MLNRYDLHLNKKRYIMNDNHQGNVAFRKMFY